VTRLVVLSPEALRALADGDADTASDAAGLRLPPGLVEDTWLWRLRVQQLADDPSFAPWLPRAIVDTTTGAVVGYANFHGPPDDSGMVEVGYEVLPEYRRRGHARAALQQLIDFAREHGARTIRASVSPDNTPSLNLVAAFAFTHVGEQWDERDGRELIFERAASSR
jgi:RimJ/RimL family protein N-acetyltransferase